ncbi:MULTISPECIES: serine hydrolase [unclassified Rhodococcus (in: high G+C Gram-positive bacteria)]|uniref:serine hydrolase n=1 Tax=unclassified Rhodococcus (in: high G+C Gram-positive bacteria) TaxID=192944 RepID=UPI00146B430B|nr:MULTISPECIES: serine hydrolase [unclassified Rhodococcus (in: high G+C Gram-positive bacteria)]MBF0662155.1 serine hydrolase [Rhodococcus sp. (in: high G+C Gram-positive bacteria)]NMD96065.1 serine hydrolase [Rhodococcus sp. BL-253-APC-6A1W]NME79007.1 serine hydrolase [Rhodococcus sp. 105337]
MASRSIPCVAIAVALTLTGCAGAAAEPDSAGAAPVPRAADCEAVPEADVTTAEGWIGYVAENTDTVAIALDDGKGTVLDHRSDEPHPLASAVKVVHLAAYAQAVAEGRLDPLERVPVTEWERWYLPNTDGNAHPAALERLDATGPAAVVTLDEMVTAMVRESDNAVPDYLRDRLGDDALTAAAARGGWSDFRPPTMLGTTLALFDSSLDEAAVWPAARRYADDPRFRDEIMSAAQLGDDVFADVDRIQRFGNAGSAADLARLHRAIADGSFGPGADIAREHLEWQPAPEGFAGVGFKGGSLPGVLTEAMTFRREDGSIATAVLLSAGMSESEYTSALESLPHQQLLAAAANDPATAERIRCAM